MYCRYKRANKHVSMSDNVVTVIPECSANNFVSVLNFIDVFCYVDVWTDNFTDCSTRCSLLTIDRSDPEAFFGWCP